MINKGKILNKKSGFILIIIAILICLAATLFNVSNKDKTIYEATTEAVSTINDRYDTAIVLRIIDGDTLLVERNQKEERIRLIGVDTPESVNPDKSKNIEQGKVASEYTKSIIKEGQTVFLEFDTELNDDYERTLAYVWLTDKISFVPSLDEISENMLNGMLLSEGYAKTMKIKPNTKYSYRFDLIEMKAKAESKGFWKDYYSE